MRGVFDRKEKVMYSIGDIVQITNEDHPWFPAILVVDEGKKWGVQAYVIVPESNDGSHPCTLAFTRLKNEGIQKVGELGIVVE
jgi:hypothetical protein